MNEPNTVDPSAATNADANATDTIATENANADANVTSPEGNSAIEGEGHSNNDPSKQTDNQQQSYYNSKYKTLEAFESAHKELERGFHNAKEENSKWKQVMQTVQPYLDAIEKHPEWGEALLRGSLPGEYEEMPTEQKVDIAIKSAVDKATKPLLEQIEALKKDNSQTSETLGLQSYKAGLNETDLKLFNKYETEIQSKRTEISGLSWDDAAKIVIPQSEKEELIQQKIKQENQVKRDATVGASAPTGGVSQPVQGKLSVAEALEISKRELNKT